MLQFGLRLGEHPQVVVTNTPLPSKKYKEIRSHPRTYRIGGSTFENRAHLAPSFFDRVTGQYQGTRLGRQELEAELFEDTPGALWSTALLESTRCKDAIPRGVDIVRTVIGVDPAGRIQDMTRLVLGVSAKTREPGKGDEAGIVVACLGDDGHAYVLADCSTLGSPHAWGAAVADAYLRYAADRVVGEANHGGVTVEEVIRTVAKHRGVPNIAYKPVWASKGKHTRAEPVAALYEQNRVHHIGCHSELEAEMCDWLPGGSSPNRMDALVFTLTELMLQGGSGGSVEVGVPRERDAPLFAS
jgi:phage terminase large subunit-like protein